MDTDHHRIKNDKGEIINEPEEIIIGDKVWIGCRALVLKGTVVPSNAVIAANSVVSKELEQENALYAGIPAKMIKQNVTWE
jgi:acetyltransferase-like isoleucine patch superfamily enzyme